MQLCTELRLGAVLDWLFESEAPVAFNTHFHEEGVVRYPEGMADSKVKCNTLPLR